MLDSYLRCRPIVNLTFCEDGRHIDLIPKNVAELEYIRLLLEPFARITTELSAESNVNASKVVVMLF